MGLWFWWEGMGVAGEVNKEEDLVWKLSARRTDAALDDMEGGKGA